MLKDFSKYEILLASKSPRRSNILEELQLKFRKVEIEFDENYPNDLRPNIIAAYLAEKKSITYKNKIEDHQILLSADTIVVQNDEVLEKPNDKGEAKEMLSMLSGSEHEVITGVCMRNPMKKVVFTDHSVVHFNDINEKEMDFYIDNFKPFDKAGSYGIQDWLGMARIKRIEGSYLNIVGLPAHRIIESLENW